MFEFGSVESETEPDLDPDTRTPVGLLRVLSKTDSLIWTFCGLMGDEQQTEF